MKPTLHLAMLAAALAALALVASAWRGARRDAQHLSATLATQNATIHDAAGREKDRDAQLAAALASIDTQKRAVRTPQQAARELPSVFPPLPLPIFVRLPDLSATNAAGNFPAAPAPSTISSVPQAAPCGTGSCVEPPRIVNPCAATPERNANPAGNSPIAPGASAQNAPAAPVPSEIPSAAQAAPCGTGSCGEPPRIVNPCAAPSATDSSAQIARPSESTPSEPPPATISIPQADLVPLYDDLQDCAAANARNAALAQDLADEKTRSAALLRERDAAVTSAHGGGFLAHLKQAANWFFIGAAAGAAATAVARH
jgi:hypothetical protein